MAPDWPAFALGLGAHTRTFDCCNKLMWDQVVESLKCKGREKKMCAGDDKNCPDFELHHRNFKETLDRERRSFLKSSFAAAGGAAAMTAGGISLVTPQMAAAAEKNQPANRSYHHLPANADTVHWGYFSKQLKPQVEIDSGDFITIEALTHHANDDAERMVKGDPGAESVFLWTKEKKGVNRRGAGEGMGVHICTGPVYVRATRMIIDCHGHYTTAPKALEAWRNRQIAGIKDPAQAPKVAELTISDDELRESSEWYQLRLMRERGCDLTIFSPRASFMAHHIGDFAVSSTWAWICNELCFRVSKLFPDHFIGAAMLPQSPGVDPRTCIPELERCVRDYGFVAVNLNPDPSGGHWTSPPLTDRHWYPIYEKMVEWDIPAMVHVSTSCNACFHTTGAHYINADTTAVMQFIQGALFKDFPALRFVVPHGGGAAPYHWGRYRGLAQELKKPLLTEHLLKNVFFDTCVYHQPGVDLLTKVIPVDNILFASEMIGAVRGVDPETGYYYDDTKRYIEASTILSPDAKQAVYECNARRVFSRLDAALKAKGK